MHERNAQNTSAVWLSFRRFFRRNMHVIAYIAAFHLLLFCSIAYLSIASGHQLPRAVEIPLATLLTSATVLMLTFIHSDLRAQSEKRTRELETGNQAYYMLLSWIRAVEPLRSEFEETRKSGAPWLMTRPMSAFSHPNYFPSEQLHFLSRSSDPSVVTAYYSFNHNAALLAAAIENHCKLHDETVWQPLRRTGYRYGDDLPLAEYERVIGRVGISEMEASVSELFTSIDYLVDDINDLMNRLPDAIEEATGLKSVRLVKVGHKRPSETEPADR